MLTRRIVYRFIMIWMPALVWLSMAWVLQAQSPDELARQVQAHYGQLASLKADFMQIYEANSIRQVESGLLYLKKPGLMRWDYREPESKLFVADGKNIYFHVPSARQVSVRRIGGEDLHFTPFGFLVGQGDLARDFEISNMDAQPANSAGIHALRLLPRRPFENVSSMILELDARTLRIQALVLYEYTGGISRFEFTNMTENPRLNSSLFSFRIPKGVEIIRLDEP
jgi:outer membrane lipoprotein carrier protein